MGFRDIVAHNVRRLRRRNRWTQEQLAELLDRHKQTIWAIEASRHGINDRLMDDLARVFGVSFSELLREYPQEDEGAPETAGAEAWDGGAAGYVAESPGGACSSRGLSPDVIEPQQVREWIRLAVREAVEAVLAEGAGPGGERAPSAGGRGPKGGPRRRARKSDGGE